MLKKTLFAIAVISLVGFTANSALAKHGRHGHHGRHVTVHHGHHGSHHPYFAHHAGSWHAMHYRPRRTITSGYYNTYRPPTVYYGRPSYGYSGYGCDAYRRPGVSFYFGW